MIGLLGYLAFPGYLELQWIATVLVVLACAWPARRGRLRRTRLMLARLARHRFLVISLVFVFSLAITAALAARRGIPRPYVHDEFSYLLAADTFAHGRLTNPTPPAWEHFESMHILLRPSYMSKYPPGQGLFLALGQVAFGHPIWGAWISTALAAAAVCWMFYGLMPPQWALLGGLMTAMHPQLLEWGQRYWGGSVAVLGGTLFFGGFTRIVSQRIGRWSSSGTLPARVSPVSASIAMAFGALIMANSRPFEGLLFAALAGVWMLIWMLGHKAPPLPILFRRVILPAGLVVLLGASWMGYYNHRITGIPWRLPYAEHQAQYGVVPLFIFQPKNPQPQYNHQELDIFCVRESGYWHDRRGKPGEMWREACKNVVRLYEGCLGNVAVLAVPLLILPWIITRDQRYRAMVLILIAFTLGLLAETFMYPHYAAPITGLVAAITVISVRWIWRLGRVGALLARSTLAVYFLWATLWWLGFFFWRPELNKYYWARERLQNSLVQQGGKHLVVVRYGPHNVHQEWVYNGADLASAPIIWARHMDTERNQHLLKAFADRKAWLATITAEPLPGNPDHERVELQPYPQ